jgi:hypothetical protein
MRKTLIVCSLVMVGCGDVSHPLDIDSGAGESDDINKQDSSNNDSGTVSLTDSGRLEDASQSNQSDAGHDASSPVRLDAGHEAGTPDKDSGVSDSHVAPKDAGVDSWVAPPTCTDVPLQCGSSKGANCPACSTGGVCIQQSDCAIGGCDYTGHCITSVSCIQHHGGDTCGAGEDTDLGANAKPATGEESCCTTIAIPGTNYTVDKYLITAGRMRAMVTALNGNLRAFTESIPASNPYWNPAWNAYIPSSTSEVDQAFGPYPNPLSPDPYNPNNETQDPTDGFPLGWLGQWRWGCTEGNPLVVGGTPDGARTWYTNYMLPGDLAPVAYPQDYLDDKFLNCVDAYTLTAFCIWDGGHLATLDELAAAWGTGNFPWSYISPYVSIITTCSTYDDNGNCLDADYEQPTGTDANGLDMSSYIAHEFGGSLDQFITPFTYDYDPYGLFADDSIHIPAPGRFPLGNSVDGVSDLVGATYTITAIVEPTTSIYPPPTIANSEHTGTMAGSGSFEIHPVYPGSGVSQEDQTFRPAWWAYWAGGGRCAR